MSAPIFFASEDAHLYKSDLLGLYQQKNARTAVAAIHHLKEFEVSQENILNGLFTGCKKHPFKRAMANSTGGSQSYLRYGA